MDCDDMMQDDFIEKALKIISSKADLYIYGIERVPIKGENESWVVEDREYTNNMEFADEYILSGRLMVYSNCNKFYKKSIIDKANLRFEEELGFGEERCDNNPREREENLEIIKKYVSDNE